MVLQVFRALFVLLMAAVGYQFLKSDQPPFGDYTWMVLAISITLGVFVVCIDILAPRKKLTVFAGTFFGLLVGVFISYALSFVVELIVEQTIGGNKSLVNFSTILLGCISCYLAISFVLQTKDDFRFIVPYVEFSKQTKGTMPLLLDTSALIDGRIADVADTGVFENQMIVPRFVLRELQQVADSADRLKRNRGRRGLDILARMQANKKLDIVVYEASHQDDAMGVDQLLVSLARELNGRVVTTDFNLNKVAQLSGVGVINLNDLANALKQEVLPGETMTVRIVKPGEEPSQGVGYLDDGTMVVVEHGRGHLNSEVDFVVTNTRQTSAGKMIFGRLHDGEAPAERQPNPGRRRGRPESRDPERGEPVQETR